MAATKSAIYGVNHMNSNVPTRLNIIWERAVRLAFTVPPIEASSAVVVEPILVPNRIGMAPVSPMILLTPSGPAVAARFWSTAIDAELLWTTVVMTAPTMIPRNGMSATLSISCENIWLCASGSIAAAIILSPEKSIPKANIACPKSVIFS